MADRKVAKITISLSSGLLDYADRIAKERRITRSGLIAELLENEKQARIREQMALGYREMAEENRRESEEALNLTSDVMLRNEGQ